MRDLVVAGGGPVGLAVALYAARAGLDVVVREPRTGPVDKACGEGLMPGARASLARLGVHLDHGPDAQEFHGIRYLSPGHLVQARFSAGPGLGVRRTVLSTALQQRASELGVRRLRQRAGAPVQESKVADKRTRIVVDHRGDFGARFDQSLGEMAADEAARPGDKHLAASE